MRRKLKMILRQIIFYLPFQKVSIRFLLPGLQERLLQEESRMSAALLHFVRK